VNDFLPSLFSSWAIERNVALLFGRLQKWPRKIKTKKNKKKKHES
jgi:hypothetical protein